MQYLKWLSREDGPTTVISELCTVEVEFELAEVDFARGMRRTGHHCRPTLEVVRSLPLPATYAKQELWGGGIRKSDKSQANSIETKRPIIHGLATQGSFAFGVCVEGVQIAFRIEDPAYFVPRTSPISAGPGQSPPLPPGTREGWNGKGDRAL